MPGFVVSIGVMRLEKRGSMAVSLSDVISASETGSNHCPGRPAPRLIQTRRRGGGGGSPEGDWRPRPRDHVPLHDFLHATHCSNLPRPYTNLTTEVVSQIIGTRGGVDAVSVATVAADQTSWRTVRWRNRGADREWVVRCTALRVTPAHDWRRRRLAPEVWLLCEQDTGTRGRTKYYFLHAPATTTWRKLVRFAHHRWAIEQQYRELKTDLGFDHFEGRSFPGLHHHVVLTAVAYNFLQAERRRHFTTLTFPAVKAIVQEIFLACLSAQRPGYQKRIEALSSVKLQI